MFFDRFRRNDINNKKRLAYREHDIYHYNVSICIVNKTGVWTRDVGTLLDHVDNISTIYNTYRR